MPGREGLLSTFYRNSLSEVRYLSPGYTGQGLAAALVAVLVSAVLWRVNILAHFSGPRMSGYIQSRRGTKPRAAPVNGLSAKTGFPMMPGF